MERLKKWISDEGGATAVEYCIMAALIAGTIVATVTILGNEVKDFFENFVGTF